MEGGFDGCHVPAMSVRAFAVPMVVWAGGPDPVCVVMFG